MFVQEPGLELVDLLGCCELVVAGGMGSVVGERDNRRMEEEVMSQRKGIQLASPAWNEIPVILTSTSFS